MKPQINDQLVMSQLAPRKQSRLETMFFVPFSSSASRLISRKLDTELIELISRGVIIIRHLGFIRVMNHILRSRHVEPRSKNVECFEISNHARADQNSPSTICDYLEESVTS